MYKGIKYSKCNTNELKCVAYVNHWHQKLKLPLPHPHIKPIKPPPARKKTVTLFAISKHAHDQNL